MHPIIQTARNESRILLTEVESKEILGQAGINVVETRLATSKSQAISFSQQLGFPVVLKIVSPDITHKSDVGGVKLGLATAAQVEQAYDDILGSARRQQPQAKILGVSVQKMALPGTEVIIGVSRDAQFGMVIMFGLGGVWVEALKDVVLRVIPITRKDAEAMIKEIKGYSLLSGYRGQKPADINKIVDSLLAVSKFVEENPEIKEIDINPLIVYSNSILAIDARVILKNPSPEES
jgi:acyl-CoA synthetase (NDP forming)